MKTEKMETRNEKLIYKLLMLAPGNRWLRINKKWEAALI